MRFKFTLRDAVCQIRQNLLITIQVYPLRLVSFIPGQWRSATDRHVRRKGRSCKEWLPEVFDLFYVNENLKHLHGEGSEISMINCDGTGITLEAVPESMKHYILDDLNDLLKDWKHIPGAKTNIETLIKYTQRAEFTDEHHAVFRKKFRLMDQYKKTDVFKLSPRFKELYEY